MSLGLLDIRQPAVVGDVLDMDTISLEGPLNAALEVLLAVPLREAPLVRTEHLGSASEKQGSAQ